MARKVDHIEELDHIIGRRIKEMRQLMGMSRKKLGLHIGVTHQQVQKYEDGINRVSAGRLFYIAEALGKSLHFFYQELASEIGTTVLEDTVNYRKSMEVTRNFMKIRNIEHQNAINVLIRKLANSQTTEESETPTNG